MIDLVFVVFPESLNVKPESTPEQTIGPAKKAEYAPDVGVFVVENNTS